MKLAIVVGLLAYAPTATADSFTERWSLGYLPAGAFDPTPFHLQAANEANQPTYPEEPTSAWFKIVAALNRDSARLDGEDRKFLGYMLDKLTRNPAYVPTAPQAKWILHMAAKLGRDLP
jgi:hypothetical protein